MRSWRGNPAEMRSNSSASEARSASVTISTSPLYSIMTRRAKWVISKAPASRAIAVMAGTNSDRLTPPMVPASVAAFAAVFRDVHDLVLVDEQVGRAFARQADHSLVVVFDPPFDGFAVHQLHGNLRLLLTECLQVSGFLIGLFRRWSFGFLLERHRRTKWHGDILHGASKPAFPLRASGF